VAEFNWGGGSVKGSEAASAMQRSPANAAVQAAMDEASENMMEYVDERMTADLKSAFEKEGM
jgi:hypothetical protein